MADIKEASTNLYVVSNKYGVVESKLTSGFSKDSEATEKKYKIENIPSEVLDICKELESIGGRALLVGGSVRDCVISKELPDMKLKPKDFDLEVYGMTAEVLQRVLVAKFGEDKVDSVGRAFGILKVKIEGWDEPLDFSIPRIDSKTGEGHKGFVVTGRPDMTLRDAAARRDITANSMAYDPLTEIIYDPYGGIKDIKDRLIRVTDEKTFQEDPLRVIRVMQFAARFEFNVEPKTEALCKTMVERGDVDYKKSRNGKDGDGHFIEGDEEKEGEHKGFLVISEGRQVYMKPEETEEEK